ncbi:MAG: FliI/YscN family ATPase [Planctomycetota bacterium]
MSALTAAIESVRRSMPMRIEGVIASLRGMTVLVDDLPLPVGSLVRIMSGDGATRDSFGEIVGFTREQAIIMMLGVASGVRPGDRVVGEQVSPSAPVGDRLLGRVLNGLGAPLDIAPTPSETQPRSLTPEPLSPLRRRPVNRQMLTGVRAIDLMTSMGVGQRLGVFSGPGVGKSTLLGMIARGTNADVNVIALIGERGREVREFIEQALGAEGMARSVVVVATGDESPLMRIRAAKYACCIAEHFRDRGRDVMLMMDSVTRFAHAQRQVGLSVGEPPASKGYTPSVFAQLALLLERAGGVDAAPGTSGGGSITGLYTILVEGDDLTEPVADAARGILDGHVVLSRELAQRAHFPAIDVLDSISRVADQVTTREHTHARRALSRLLGAYRKVEDLVQIGAYVRGSSAETDAAIALRPAIEALLRQQEDEDERFDESLSRLMKLISQAEELATHAPPEGVAPIGAPQEVQ